jgi:uncharacterized protein (TIGR02444 family)
MTAEEAGPTSPFWSFSLRFYADPDVAKACIALQDGSGVDVNVLLFVLWAASRGRRLSVDDVRELTAAVDGWRTGVVAPLRMARRNLRSPPPRIDPDLASALRQRVKRVELEAERLEQDALYRFRAVEQSGEAEPSRDAAAVANVKAYAAVLATELAPSAVATVLAAFRKVGAGEDR